MTKELEIVLETGGMSFQFDQFLNVEKEVDKFLNNKENLQRLIAPLLPENLDEIIENKIPIVKDGEDGLTPTDEQLIALIEPRIPEPLKGDTPKKGIDYFTKKELEEVKKSLKVAIMSEMTNHVTKEEVNIKLEEIKKQINKLPTTGGAQFLRQLMDVNVGTPTAQQYGLTYNPSRSEFSLTAITGGGAVDSVNGQTGVVVLDQDDIGDGTTYKQYSQTEKTKLAGIETGAEVNTIDTVSDTSEIDLAITARDLTATIRSGSIDESKLDASVNASLDLADTALQSSAIGVSVQAYSSVLQNTTASFTTTDETKLDNITVTQAVNLDTMESDIAALANGMVYKGNWDASAGTFPGAGSAQTGWFYTVSVGGTVDSVVFNVGDRLIATTDNASTTTYSGNWTQLDATDAVTSVFGRTGNVVATNGDYTASNITNVPAGNIAATDVQTALNELDTEKVPYTGATADLNLGTHDIVTDTARASTSAGLLVESANGTDVGLLGAGNTANIAWYGNHNFDTATQDTIAGFTGAGKTLGSLATATYPSLTELAYVKGVTSAIQTQLDGKVDENGAITGATKTKITYDAKGLVTAGADATTADIADSTNKRYVTDADLTDIGNLSGTNTGDQTITNSSDATSHTVTLSASGGSLQLIEGTNITLTTGGTASAGTVTIAASGGSGDVTKVGTPANNQMAVWTGDGTLEGTSDFTYDGTSLNLITGKNFQIAGATVLADSAGTTTLSNIDALDATTESTIESAIDTLANLTSIQGRTVTLADAGANAVFGWDDVAGAYENLTAGEVRGAIGLATTDSPQFTAIELGNASDTTLSRVSAGVIAVEGKTLANLTDGGTFAADISVPDEAYGSGWNGSVEVPTKNAIYDKIETLGGGAYQLMSYTSGTNTTSFAVTGLDLATDLRWKVLIKTEPNGAASAAAITLRINGVSTASSYWYNRTMTGIDSGGGTATDNVTEKSNGWKVTSATVNSSMIELDFSLIDSNRANSPRPTVRWNATTSGENAADTFFTGNGGGFQDTQTNITSITVEHGSARDFYVWVLKPKTA